MVPPQVGLQFYLHGWMKPDGNPVLCEVVEIRDGEIVRYEPVNKKSWAGEVHVNFFSRIVSGLPA